MSGLDPHSGRRVVSLSKIHLPPKRTGYRLPRMLWLRPDMTEKLFTGTLSKRKQQQQKTTTCKPELARTTGFGPSVFSSFFLNTGKIFRIKFCFGLQDINRPMLHEIPENWINRKHGSNVAFLLSLVDCSEN